MLKISNPKNKKSVVLKNTKRIKYPDFYKILITEPVVKELELNVDLPILEIIELKKINPLSQKKPKYSMKRKNTFKSTRSLCSNFKYIKK